MKKPFRSLVFPTVLAAALVAGAASGAAGAGGALSGRFKGVAQSFGTGPGKTDVMADSAEYDFHSDWTDFTGHVAIRHKGFELRADRIRYNAKTGDAQAFGNVALVGEDGTLVRAETLDVNLALRAGRVETVDLYCKPFRVIAEDASMSAAGAKVYEIGDVTLTTCTNEPGRFHWSVHADRARLRPGDDATAWGAVPRLFGIPFFYLPYYWKDLERHYGFRFQPGYRGSWGAYLLSTYKMPILRDKEAGEYIDNYVFFDLRSKRGWAVGDRIAWQFGDDESKGFAAGYWMPEDGDLPEELDLADDDARYRIRLRHDWNATSRDRVLAHALFVSDVWMQKDFFRKEYREMTEPDNYATWTHYGDGWSAGLTARARLNDFYGQVERLPEAWFDLGSTELAGTGLYLENASSAAFLRRRFAEPGDGAFLGAAAAADGYDAFRADTRFLLSYPGKYFGWLSFVPRAGWRGTYYGKTRKAVVSDHTETTVSTNAFGEVSTAVKATRTTDWEEDGAGFRSVFETGVDLSTRAYGFWTGADGSDWRHVVEPYADWAFTAEPNLLPAELYDFDAVDRIGRRNTLRLGVRQRWQNRDAVRRRETEPWYADAWVDLDLDPADGADSFVDAGWDVRWRPASWLSLRTTGLYDNAAEELDTAEVQLASWHDVFRCNALYRYRNGENSLLHGGVTWFATDRWAFNAFVRYEFETSQVEEVGGWVQRSWDCLAIRLIASVEPGYENAAGLDEKDDWRVTVTGWLLDFAPANLLEEDAR